MMGPVLADLLPRSQFRILTMLSFLPITALLMSDWTSHPDPRRSRHPRLPVNHLPVFSQPSPETLPLYSYKTLAWLGPPAKLATS